MSKIPEWKKIQSIISDGTPVEELPPLERLIYHNEPSDHWETGTANFWSAKEFRDAVQALVDEYEGEIALLRTELLQP